MFPLTLRACLALLFLFSLVSEALAGVRLNLSHNQDRTTAVHKAMEHMAEHVYEATQGEVLVRIYPNGQLGSQRESMELMQFGAIDMVKSNASELESFSPAFGAFNLPYLFADRSHYYRVLDSDLGDEILLSSKPRGFVGLTYYDGGSRSFYASKPITSPSDLAGMKIRVQPSPSAIRMIQLMGGSPTPLSYGELYTALHQGVVDGAENSEMALTRARHGEVAKVYSRDEHTMVPDVLVISTRSLERLTTPQRAALQSAAKSSMLYMKTLWEDEVQQARSSAEKMGVSFVEVDKGAFVEAVKPMHNEALNNPDISPYLIRIQNKRLN